MRIFTLMLFVALLFIPVLTWGARGPSDVSVGAHNLSSSGPNPSFYNTDEASICVFCHTPHGGTLDGPLWNRGDATSAVWKHYNSATLSTSLKGLSASRPPNPESMLCLSCHDGSLSINHVINEPNDRTAAIKTSGTGSYNTTIVDFFGDPGARTGGAPGWATSGDTGNFTDDHPFSFSYTDVLASTEYQSGNAKYNTLKLPGTAVGLGVQFFTGSLNVECSSCHDPHVNHRDNPTWAPFLITPNTGSALCLACHTK